MKHYIQLTQVTLHLLEVEATNEADAQMKTLVALDGVAGDLSKLGARSFGQPPQISMITPDSHLSDEARR